MPVSKPLTENRAAAVAGSFYPGDARGLANLVGTLLTEATTEPRPGLRAIIAPHAGYPYSGAVAAEAFAALAGADFERIVLIGPAHYVPIGGIVAPAAPAFATPLGAMPVDRDRIGALAAEGLIAIDSEAHAPEHALEVELPFLQTVLGDLPILPLLVHARRRDVAEVLDRIVDDTALLVVSTDLSHYLDYASARRRDLETAEKIDRLEHGRIGSEHACGFSALNGALLLAKRRGWTAARLDLRNSGDTGTDRRRVVGYGAWALAQA